MIQKNWVESLKWTCELFTASIKTIFLIISLIVAYPFGTALIIFWLCMVWLQELTDIDIQTVITLKACNPIWQNMPTWRTRFAKMFLLNIILILLAIPQPNNLAFISTLEINSFGVFCFKGKSYIFSKLQKYLSNCDIHFCRPVLVSVVYIYFFCLIKYVL